MANPTRKDPYKNFNFLVEIDGMTQAGFSECSGLRLEIDVIEYREGSEPSSAVRKAAGLAQSRRHYAQTRHHHSNQLQAWIESIAKGIVNRKNGVIILLDDERKPVVRWKFFNAFPRKWEGPVFAAKGTDVAIETLTLCCERLERD